MKVGQGPSTLQAQIEAQQQSQVKKQPALRDLRNRPLVEEQETLRRPREDRSPVPQEGLRRKPQGTGQAFSSQDDLDEAGKRIAQLNQREAPTGRRSAQVREQGPVPLGQVLDITV